VPPQPSAHPEVAVPVDSPFEAEEDDEPVITLSPEPLADVFELEAEDEDDEKEEEESEWILPELPESPRSLFEVDTDDARAAEPIEEPVPPPPFPEYSVRRPTSLFELADDDDLEEDFDEPLFAEVDEDDVEPDPGNVFEVDPEDDDEDLLDDSMESSPDTPPTPIPVEPGAEADDASADELEEMMAGEEEESEIRSSGPFYF
jgi:hypothetical protein